jgi:hypothetical protein
MDLITCPANSVIYLGPLADTLWIGLSTEELECTWCDLYNQKATQYPRQRTVQKTLRNLEANRIRSNTLTLCQLILCEWKGTYIPDLALPSQRLS